MLEGWRTEGSGAWEQFLGVRPETMGGGFMGSTLTPVVTVIDGLDPGYDVMKTGFLLCGLSPQTHTFGLIIRKTAVKVP